MNSLITSLGIIIFQIATQYINIFRYRTTTANGQTINYINVEPLTTRVREHFGCDTAPGGYLENNGGSGSAGSHWERRVFYNEVSPFPPN